MLQRLVFEASAITGAPIATVSLLLRNVQFFRAHVGLPADLAETRATDRCVSFCQVVAAERTALCVEDAELDERIPQTLVRTHGVRAYLGVPVFVDEQIVGTLCVIDTRPRAFSQEQRAALSALATGVTSRLGELAGRSTPADGLSRVTDEALRSCVTELDGGIVMARVSAVELESRLRALDRAIRDGDRTSLEVLADSSRAATDLSEALGALEETSRRAVAIVQAREQLDVAKRGATLDEAVHLAASLAGGVSWRWESNEVIRLIDQTSAVAALATSMSAIIKAGWPIEEAIELRAVDHSESIEFRVRSSTTAATAGAAALAASGIRHKSWAVGNELVIRIPAVG